MATSLPPSGSIRRASSGWTVIDNSAVRRRATTFMVLTIVAFSGLMVRLWYLQVVRGANYLAMVQRQRTRSIPVPAARGLITDRNGKLLAASRSQHSIAVVRGALPTGKKGQEERTRILSTLAFLLGMKTSEIEEQLTYARDQLGTPPFTPVIVAHGVDLPTITLIEENKPRLGSAVLVADDIKRVYPGGSLAGHLLGYTGKVTRGDLERETGEKPGRQLNPDDTVGKSGIEREYDDLLAGQRGSEEWEVDARERPIRSRGRKGDQPGNTVQLTLDMKLQQAAEAGLASARNNGSVAVVDPRNGEVLALASRPGFDPNIFSLPRKEFRERYRELLKKPGHPFLNRPVSSRFPPGSTFKMVTATAGLEKGVVDPNWSVTCNGGMKYGRFFGCWATHGSGVNLAKAMALSCDVYFYQLSLKLGHPEGSGPTYLADMARHFGLGQTTGIDLPSDSAGLVPDPEWRRRYNRKRPELARWFPGNTLNMSIGQGDVLATPLQMALATAAVANRGTLWKPHLLLQAKDLKGKVVKKYQPEGKPVGVTPAHMELVRRSMRDVVTSGTGKACALPNVAVAGKTGSAEDDNHGLPHAWWVCFAPYENPTIAIAVMVENAGHGSDNAVPIAKKILQAAFPAAPEAAPAP